MDKEQLIKLAEIAGYEFCDENDFCEGSFWPTSEWEKKNGPGNEIDFDAWQPHKYIAQAFEVLEGCGYFYLIDNMGKDRYNIELNRSMYFEDMSLPEAICNAVLKATEQG